MYVKVLKKKKTEELKMEKNKNILNSEEIQAMSTNFAERLEKQEKANEIYEKLLKSWGLATFEYEPFEIDGEVFNACKVGKGKIYLESFDYPDYYGGAYLNTEGDLVVHVVGEIEEALEKIKTAVPDEESYRLVQAHYSYKQLLSLKEKLDILDKSTEQQLIFSNITGWGPSDRDNLFIVEMKELNLDQIKKFKEYVIDSSMIVFRQSDFDIEDATVRPGGRVTRGTGISTAAIRARRTSDTTNQGFIMSGHATAATGDIIRVNGNNTTQLGTVRNRQVSGRVDSAYFQRAGTNITLSTLLQQNSRILNTATATASVGTIVNMAGDVSGIQSGEVTSVNTTSSGDGMVTLTGSRARYTRANGDSGAPVYVFTSSNNQRRIVGIHARGNATTGFYVLIANTLSAFSLQLF